MEVVYLNSTINQEFPRFRQKMVLLGMGIESMVWSDGKFAYKECKFSSNYIKWLLNLKENKLHDSPNIPEIHAIYVDKARKMCFVKMEILKFGRRRDMERLCDKFETKIFKFSSQKAKKTNISSLDKILNNLAMFLRKQEDSGAMISLDLHSENIMLRHKQIVITDPVL